MNPRNDNERQNIQMELDFSSEPAGEARKAGRRETESPLAVNDPESPASTNRLMEEVCEQENLREALRQVKANKGSAGVDGMTVGQLTDYLKQHWSTIRGQLLSGTYEPQPVRRVEIPKPDGGGVRKLGIPTVSAYCTCYNTASESSRLSYRILEERRTHSNSSCSFSAQSVIQYGEPALSLRASINPRSIQ